MFSTIYCIIVFTDEMATGGSDASSEGRSASSSSSKKKVFGFQTNIDIPPEAVGALTFAGGALVGAVILYGVKKIYNYMSTPKPDNIDKDSAEVMPLNSPSNEISAETTPNIPEITYNDFSDEPHLKPETLSNEDPESGDDPSEGSVKDSEGEESSNDGKEGRQVDKNLHDSLLHYYNSYVHIPSENMHEAVSIVESIKERFNMYMHELLPNFCILGLHGTGSAMEGLQAVYPEQFDMLISLTLDSDVWQLVDAGQTVLRAHGYWLIRRKNLEFFTLGSSQYDKFMIGEYLSPNKVKMAFQDFTNRVGKWSSEWKVQANVIGTAVELTVIYGQGQKLKVDFRPSVVMDNVQVIAKPHPLCQTDRTYDNFWRQSFALQELDKMHTAKENGCQGMCVKILKAIRLNHPDQLGHLPSYIFKTIVLHLLDAEEDWMEEAMSERFLDTLKFLEECLKVHQLPHYFSSELNLLQGVDPIAQDMIRDFVTHIIEQHQFQWLLKTEY